MKELVKELAGAQKENLRRDFEHFHQNPELSFKEYQTAEYIRNTLKELGIPMQEGISGMLCRAKDEKSLYEAMNSFCRKTREEREAMGKAGRAWMEERFDKTFVVEKTIQAILK